VRAEEPQLVPDLVFAADDLLAGGLGHLGGFLDLLLLGAHLQ
jgi:hypothetical protein